jgi:hypothetical protein
MVFRGESAQIREASIGLLMHALLTLSARFADFLKRYALAIPRLPATTVFGDSEAKLYIPSGKSLFNGGFARNCSVE